jgi:type II secretory pathway pseudopilin PulG
MTRTLRREGGFTMIELLLVCVISLIVFGATLTAWTSIYRSNRALESQEDNAESARVALDRAARQLRNLANPTVNAITTIDRATDYDFIFQTSDPSKTWVRYCLQTSGGGKSVNDATSVFLRNQNEGPTSEIGTPVTRLSKERVLLNGSGSTDPEGRTLEYFWFETAPSAATIASTPCTSPFPGAEWQGVTFNKKFDAGTAGQVKTFYLLVRDPGCLTHMSSVTFSVPT